MVKKLNITHEIVIKKTEIIRLENEISERFTRPFSTGAHFLNHWHCVLNGIAKVLKNARVFTSNIHPGRLMRKRAYDTFQFWVSHKMNEPIRSQR